MLRWLLFLLAIIVGFALGLFYTWRINPVDYTDSEPDTLRIDYQTDYLLMVAEVYSDDGDIPNAIRRLTHLTLSPSNEIVSRAINNAEESGYNNSDLILMRTLLYDLELVSTGSDYPEP